MGLGEFFALASAFVWALAVILFRRTNNVLPPFETNLYKIILGFVLLWPTLLVAEGFTLPEFTLAEFGTVMLSGYLGIAVADTWYLRALHLVGASRTGIISSLLSPFVIILSVLFLAESFSPWQMSGFVLVMAGLLLVSWQANREQVDSADLRKGMAFGVVAVFLMAVGVVMIKTILETRSFAWTVQIRLAGERPRARERTRAGRPADRVRLDPAGGPAARDPRVSSHHQRHRRSAESVRPTDWFGG